MSADANAGAHVSARTDVGSLAELRAEIAQILHVGAEALDERRFGDWLQLTTPQFHYRIRAFSHDLRKDMTWLEHDREGLAALVELLPKHHVNGADWLRQVTLGSVTVTSEGEARATSTLAIFHTAVDVGDSLVEGGRSRVFAVGRYHDRFVRIDGHWRLAERTVRLQTRELGVGSHLFP